MPLNAMKERANSSQGGLIVYDLFKLRWDVSTCSQVFDCLARRIFRERRHPALSWLRYCSILAEIYKWLNWVLHDGCYDSAIFDSALKEAFGETLGIFDTVESDQSGAMYSQIKVAVVATNIAKQIESFVFGNFNGTLRKDCGDTMRHVTQGPD